MEDPLIFRKIRLLNHLHNSLRISQSQDQGSTSFDTSTVVAVQCKDVCIDGFTALSNPVILVQLRQCFLCTSTNVPQPINLSQPQSQQKSNRKRPISKRKQTLCDAMCELFGVDFNDLEEPLKDCLLEAKYCKECQALILDIGVVISNIKALGEKLEFLRGKVEDIMGLAVPLEIKLEEPDVNTNSNSNMMDDFPNSNYHNGYDENMDMDEPFADCEGDTVNGDHDDIGPDPDFENNCDADVKHLPNKNGRKPNLKNLDHTYTMPGTGINNSKIESGQESDSLNPKDHPKWEPTDFNCIVCKKELKNKTCLRLHYGRMHNEFDLEQLDIPNREIHPFVLCLIKTQLPKKVKKEYKCTEPGCEVKFVKPGPLRTHRLRDHLKAEPTFHCILCPSKYYITTHLRNHYSHTHRAQDLETELAKTLDIPPDIRKLIMNLPLHERIEKTACKICGKLVKSIKQHTLFVHSDNLSKPKCSFCGKIFSTSAADLLSHVELHRISSHPWNCVFCPNPSLATFQLKSELEKHVLENHEDHAIRCTECPALVLTKARLQAHMVAHHTRSKKRRQYNCSICGHAARGPSALSIHIASHNEAPIKCDVEGCELTFKSQLLLRKHKYSHNRHNRPLLFKCSLCEKAFTSKNKLEKHSVYHLDYRPFMCDKCPGAYKNQKGLSIHMKGHEKKEGFTGRKPKRSRFAARGLVTEDWVSHLSKKCSFSS